MKGLLALSAFGKCETMYIYIYTFLHRHLHIYIYIYMKGIYIKNLIYAPYIPMAHPGYPRPNTGGIK